MSSAVVPRPDQIAELTRGLALPLAEIDQLHLQIIIEGVVQAFDALRATASVTLLSGNEAEVTGLLISRLNAMIDEDPVLGLLVASVTRGSESVNFNGANLEKRPDLSIHLTARSRRFPLIAEAKIIDVAKGEALYCAQGVNRFLVGEYAWGGREAFMIAYVRDGSTLAARLAPYLSQAPHTTTYAVEQPLSAMLPAPCDAGRSTHGRSYLYSHIPPPANDPGPITLWHLWLNADASTS